MEADSSQEQLYEWFLKYLDSARQQMFLNMTCDERREGFLIIYHRMRTREFFRACMASVAEEPDRKRCLEETLRHGFPAELTDQERDEWRGKLALLLSY